MYLKTTESVYTNIHYVLGQKTDMVMGTVGITFSLAGSGILH
jgi:hypothetical protein